MAPGNGVDSRNKVITGRRTIISPNCPEAQGARSLRVDLGRDRSTAGAIMCALLWCTAGQQGGPAPGAADRGAAEAGHFHRPQPAEVRAPAGGEARERGDNARGRARPGPGPAGQHRRAGRRVPHRGPRVHHGDERGRGLRQAEARPGAPHVPVDAGDPQPGRPHPRAGRSVDPLSFFPSPLRLLSLLATPNDYRPRLVGKICTFN